MILYAMLAIGGIGLVFGVILAVAGEKLKVEEDPKFTEVRNALPGANCGGCGYPGCDLFAQAIVDGNAEVNGCPVGGDSCSQALAGIMGLEGGASEKTVAFIRCAGTHEKAKAKYIYYGMLDCNASTTIAGGGSRACSYGCLGRGSCAYVCAFDAINFDDGIAVVDKEKCVSCGKCVDACPKKLIEIVPYDKKIRVRCNSKDNGKIVKSACSIGCIGCKICVRSCEFDAIDFENNLASVNYEKCTQCKACYKKCPTKAIIDEVEKKQEEPKRRIIRGEQ